MKKKLVVTGAMGVIATRVLSGLSEKYDPVLLDKKHTNHRGEEVDGVIEVDLLDSDREIYRKYFRGVHAVIHSAFVRPKEGDEKFFAELDNVKMAYNVYQACSEENVRRLVVISSNHAGDYYERLIHAGKLLSVTPDMAAYSDNYYGWAKVAYEALGFVFATGNVTDGRKLSNVQLRTGAPRETDIESCKTGDVKKMHRDLGAYLSLRDEIQLIVKSIETEDISDRNGIPFQIFYGVSGNTHNFWDIANAREVIGYEPEDNSSLRFADHVARITGGVGRKSAVQ